MRDRVATVLFVFSDSREIRHMREPPRLGSRVRSRHGAVATVAQVIDYGSDTYAANCVGTSRVATVPHRAADRMEAVQQRTPSVRVLFFFPDETSEIRYVRVPPRLGRRVRSPEGAVWRVADVFHTGLDTYTVTCVGPPRHFRGVDDLAVDLLEFARKSISPSRLAVPDPGADQSTDLVVPMDQHMTEGPDWVIPPDVPTALDDSDVGADERDQEKRASIEKEEPLPDYVPPRLETSNLHERDQELEGDDYDSGASGGSTRGEAPPSTKAR